MMPATSRLVEVPTTVDMPPMSVANPIGSRMEEGAWWACRAAAVSTGSSMTTTGVLLTKALKKADPTSVSKPASNGWRVHIRVKNSATGRSAPVVSSPLPTTSRAVIVISASWPMFRKKSVVRITGSPFSSRGQKWNPRSNSSSTPMPAVSSGIRSRVNRYSANTVSSITINAWAPGNSGKA